MAKVKIQGHASGTGILTVTAPNTSTDRTITLPDATGTLLTEVADDSITLAKMASGTDGNIISYDASGNPVAIATGSDGQVLTSAGAGAPPAFEAVAAGGKVLQIVSSTSNTGTYPTTSNAAVVSAGIAITPSATSSKVLYIYNAGGMISGTTSGCRLKLYNDAGGSNLLRYHTRWGYNTVSDWTPFPITFMFLDSPNSTSEVTYLLEASEQGSASWEINDSANTAGAIVMAIEIGG